MNQLFPFLDNIFPSKQEATIYVAALSLGKARITHIAKKCGLGRTNTHFYIKKMVEQGFLKESKKGSIIYITAIPPKSLQDTLTQKVQAFSTLVPKLEAMQKKEAHVPKIEVLESKEGVMQFLQHVAQGPEDSTFYVIQHGKALQKNLSLLNNQEAEQFFRQLIKKGILTKALYTESAIDTLANSLSPELYATYKKRLYDIRTFPENAFPEHTGLFIHNDMFGFFTVDTLITVIITDKTMTQILISLFHLLEQVGTPAKMK